MKSLISCSSFTVSIANISESLYGLHIMVRTHAKAYSNISLVVPNYSALITAAHNELYN